MFQGAENSFPSVHMLKKHHTITKNMHFLFFRSQNSVKKTSEKVPSSSIKYDIQGQRHYFTNRRKNSGKT